MTIELACIGIRHQTTPAPVRERLACDRTAVARLLADLKQQNLSGAILSTCGRFEAVFSTSAHDLQSCRTALFNSIGSAADPAEPYWHTLTGRRAARHLLRIAAGLESQIIGEPHVLGQVRTAYEAAQAATTTDPLISALFRAALHCGKRVRAETSLARPDASFADAAVAALPKHAPDNEPRTILLIGSGNLAQSVALRLKSRASASLLLTSRHRDRGESIARESGARFVEFDNLPAAIRRADALIACTSPCSGRFIITPDMLPSRRRRPLIMIDLGMPRNIDPAVADRAGITLTTLEDLGAIPKPDPSAIRAAESIIAHELLRFERWLAARRFHLRQILASPAPSIRAATVRERSPSPSIRAATVRECRGTLDPRRSSHDAGTAVDHEAAA